MMRGKGWWLVAVGVVLVGCEKKDDGAAAGTAGDGAPVASTAATRDTLGSAEIIDAFGRSYGTLYLAQAPGGVELFGDLHHFPPGEYGMHFHTVGRCEPGEFTTAGGHWNPQGRKHGRNSPDGAHLGDLPNVVGTPDSVAHVQAMSMGGSFTGDSTALMDADGAAVVIHLKPDDYLTDPAGNAGPRGACGVIKTR